MRKIQDEVAQCEKDIYSYIKRQNQKIHDILTSCIGKKVLYRQTHFDHPLDIIASITSVAGSGYQLGLECLDYYDYEPTQDVVAYVKMKLDREATLGLLGDLEEHPYVLAVKTRKAKNNRKRHIMLGLNRFDEMQGEHWQGTSIEKLEFLED
jgi:hypothetical protein|tara:strand:+ start:690 stop:1145 length:456 start_codon:yes stop_codon:yes gene_type:complete